jgi:hypothetical protein
MNSSEAISLESMELQSRILDTVSIIGVDIISVCNQDWLLKPGSCH